MGIHILIRHLSIETAPKSGVWWWCLCVFGMLIVKCISCLVCDDPGWRYQLAVCTWFFIISLAFPPHLQTHTHLYSLSLPTNFRNVITQIHGDSVHKDPYILHGQMITYVMNSLPGRHFSNNFHKVHYSGSGLMARGVRSNDWLVMTSPWVWR